MSTHSTSHWTPACNPGALFDEEGVKIQRKEMTYPRSPKWFLMEVRMELRILTLRLGLFLFIINVFHFGYINNIVIVEKSEKYRHIQENKKYFQSHG